MPLRAAIAILLMLTATTLAVEIRVVTFNIGAYYGENYFEYSLGDPGTPDHETVRAILQRIDADVVALQEIHSADLSGSPDDLDALAARLGYPYLNVPPVTGVFDTSLRVVFLSRFPLVSSSSIAPPAGAKDMTRRHPVVKVDVPGTDNDPLLISAHLKAGTLLADRFQRAVEMKRLTGYLTAAGIGNDDNFIVLGDFNPSGTNTTFNEQPATGLPSSFVLGPDISYPLAYSTNMLSYFTTPSAVKLDARQLNGSPSTYGTTFANGPVLDLFLVSPAIAGRPLATEIYNSALDTSNNSGLSKAGDPLAANTSATASDHYAVFADLELDADFPNLQLALTVATVMENSPAGTVAAQITLPAARTSPVTVTLASDDPAAVVPAASTVVIPAGSLTGQIALLTPRNFIADPQRSVTLSASATGYDPSSSVLQVEDADGPYGFHNPGETLVENFTGFGGLHDPAPWITSGGQSWLGSDDGSSAQPGWRVYGSGPGFLTDGAAAAVSARFENRSLVPLTALEVALDAGQWRAVMNGAADRLQVDLVTAGGIVPLPALSFTASPLPGAGHVRLSAMASGLWIPPGASFDLRISLVPGDNAAPAPADVFINEFHYDNNSTDTGEFVEIAVGPGFGGALSDIDILFYNGSNPAAATVYRTLNLQNDFTLGDIVAGYRIFSAVLPQDYIQNGANDGFAVVNKLTSQVLQLISYEGVFTATSGLTAGMTSTDIGVSQNGTDVVGKSALGLTGSGAVAGDFTWVKFSGIDHSPGQPNDGQFFVNPNLPPQGLGFEKLEVVFLTDNDLDGEPDVTDPDDDNDGQSDVYETAFGSDRLNPQSRFEPRFTRTTEGLQLSFPGAAGIAYTVESSETLDDWDQLTTISGVGEPINVPLPMEAPAMFFRVKASGAEP